MSSALQLPERTRAVRAAKRAALIEALRAALAARPPEGVREVRLFGSWARGDFDGGSDIDLLVVTETEDARFDGRGLPHAERIDVVSVTAETLAERLARGNAFLAEAAGGVELYSA